MRNFKKSITSTWKYVFAAVAGFAMVGSVFAVSQDMSREAIAKRIQPVAQVKVQAAGHSAVASSERSGEQIYNQACVACHGTGVLDAPRKGNADDWGPRLEQGMDVVIKHGIEGLNAMPPRGTCMDCSDDEIVAAIDFMLEGVDH